jgi:hypothetical protein
MKQKAVLLAQTRGHTLPAMRTSSKTEAKGTKLVSMTARIFDLERVFHNVPESDPARE